MTDNIRADHWYSGRTISIFYDRRDGARGYKLGTIESIVESFEKLWEGANAQKPYWLEDEVYLPYPWGFGIF